MSILAPLPGLLEHVNSVAAASVYKSFPSFSSLESVAHQAAHLSQGFRDRAKRKSLTSGLLSLYTSYSNNLFPHLFASKRATACNCPLFCSCFPPSDFGLVRVCFLANMSPYVTLHAEIDTLESAKFRSTTRRPSNGRIAPGLWPETPDGRRVTKSALGFWENEKGS